jgi:hypothetical protein
MSNKDSHQHMSRVSKVNNESQNEIEKNENSNLAWNQNNNL